MMASSSLTIVWIILGVFAAVIIIAVVTLILFCLKTKKSKHKDINHQRKLSSVVIENFENLEHLNWQYSRQTRAQVFPWQEMTSPWAHVVQDRPVYDAGASMNRPWIVGKRVNPIFDGDNSNRSTLQSIYRYEGVGEEWKVTGEFYPENESLNYERDKTFSGGIGLQNGTIHYGERFQSRLAQISERQSITSTSDTIDFRRDRTNSDLTDPTEDPLLYVKMNKKRPSLVVNEAQRQKKSRTGDFYAKNQKKLENYEKNIKEAGVTETVVFDY